MVNQVWKRYRVKYAMRGDPSSYAETVLAAPSMEYIRTNWNAICGGRPFVIQKITRYNG